MIGRNACFQRQYERTEAEQRIRVTDQGFRTLDVPQIMVRALKIDCPLSFCIVFIFPQIEALFLAVPSSSFCCFVKPAPPNLSGLRKVPEITPEEANN